MMHRPYHKLLVCLLGLLLLGGCNREAIDLNNAIARLHADIGKAVETYGESFSPLFAQGTTVRAADVEAAHARLVREMQAVRAKSEALEPASVASAEALVQAHRRFLAVQESLVQDELAEMARIAADESLIADNLHKKLVALMRVIREKERQPLEALHAAQRAFAEANGLPLEGPGGR